VSIILLTARAIMATMQPLTGTRSAGTVLVESSGADLVLPRNSYALPIIEGQQRPDLAMKVAEGPGTNGSWTVTAGGTQVDMFSNIGGKSQYIPTDTVLAFDPPISGIKSAVASTPFLGAADLTTFGSLKDLAMFEHMGTLQRDLSRSSIKGFPCALLTWVDDEPADSATTSMTMRETRLGTRKSMYKLTYQIAVISERGESDHARRTEGLEVLDQIAMLLADRQAVDGQPFSNPSGLQIVRRWRETGGGPDYQRYYVYGLLVSAMVTLSRDDTRPYSPWLVTNLNADKQLDGEPDLRLVKDVEIDMTQSNSNPDNVVYITADNETVVAGIDRIAAGS
jgi:hypothetical protein